MRRYLTLVTVVTILVLCDIAVLGQGTQESAATARELVEQAERCLDSYYSVYEVRVAVPADCGDGRTPEGLLERAIELDPETATAYTALAKFHASTRGRVSALETCRRMRSALPNHVATILCIYRYEKLDADERIRLNREIIELSPKHVLARRRLGNLLLGRDPIEAYTHYRIALTLFPFRQRALTEGVGEFRDHFGFIRALSRARPKEGADLLQLFIDGSGGARRKGWCRPLRSLLTGDLSENSDFQPAIAKIREHCENPDVERAVALAKEARTEDRIDEAIAAWVPLFDTEAFAQDAYLSLFGLYRRGRFSQRWSWFDWKGYDGKTRALVVKYFERERDPRNRCEAVRETNFRELLPELYDQLQQECGKIGNITGNNAVFD